MRVIAMDHLGMGRSDKPTDIASYSYLGHNDRLLRFIDGLERVPVELQCDNTLEFPVFPSKVAQVLNNLLVNAAHACEDQENPQIFLRAERHENSLQLR